MKIEQKWSLWQAQITSWCYSDYSCDFIVVSADSYDEAKNAVKVYYQRKKLDIYNKSIVFDDWEKLQYTESEYKESLFDTYHGDAEYVSISRLNIVYTWWEIAKPSLHV